MKTAKFDETDRHRVISEVEKHFGIKLSRFGNYRKFLKDSAGKSYWVFGGYDDWHGIQSAMLEEEQKHASGGILVVAKRHKAKIDIFSGELQPLVSSAQDLAHTQTGGYQFNVVVRGDSMTIKEVSGLTLRKIGALQELDPASSLQINEVVATVPQLSPEQREQLLAQLRALAKGYP